MGRETLALFGPSGCGKTMALKCIAGIEEPDSGEIILNGRTLYDSKRNIKLIPQERKLGYLFQSYALFPNMTSYENLKIALRDKNNLKKIDYYINKFSLTGLENIYPNKLSGGQKQRLALARMIINEPLIYMLDEPFSAIDDYLKNDLIDELEDLILKENIPTIFVSHNKDEVYRLSDNIAIMDEGKIIEKGSKIQIFTSPQNVYTANLIGFKNISPIKKLKDNRFLAVNWNIILNLDIDEDYKYIGINENNIDFNLSDGNILNFKITEIINNFDHKLISLVENSKQIEPIYIKVAKTSNLKIGDNIKLSLDNNIKLLKDYPK